MVRLSNLFRTLPTTKGGKSLASEIDILTDPEPAVINVKHLGATYLSIWWPSVPGTKSYTVQLIDNQSNDVISEANLSNEDILVWEQGNLLPSTEYTIRVVSIQHAKQLENSISVRTSDVPAMPTLQIQDVRSTSVQLLWKRPVEWDQNESHIVTPMFLELEYNINDSTENSQITVIEKKFDSKLVLNLEPGQHYVFALVRLLINFLKLNFIFSAPSTSLAHLNQQKRALLRHLC